jgi:hypothetical protein
MSADLRAEKRVPGAVGATADNLKGFSSGGSTFAKRPDKAARVQSLWQSSSDKEIAKVLNTVKDDGFAGRNCMASKPGGEVTGRCDVHRKRPAVCKSSNAPPRSR